MTPSNPPPRADDHPPSRLTRTRKSVVLALAVALAGAMPAGLIWLSGPADAASLVVEAETFSSVDGYGTTKQTDSTASGGYRLVVDSAVTVTKTVSTATASTGIVVRALTDSTDSPGGAYMTVSLDGTAFPQTLVNTTSWKDYTFTRSLAAGSHTVRIYFGNPEVRNLYLDTVTFVQSTQSSPSPTRSASPSVSPSRSASPSARPSASPTRSASPSASSSRSATPSPSTSASTGIREHAYLTGYSVEDNTPPGSRSISNPVVHQQAGGTGTYADPITVAVGHSIVNGKDILDFPAGTRFYFPVLRIYGIAEDTCGDGSTPQNGPCHTGYPNSSTNKYWIDIFVGSDPSDKCMDSFSVDAGWTVIRNPDAGWLVDSRPNELGAECTRYADTPVRA